MVDLTPRALLNRLERGVVYPPERAQTALQNFFKESTLVALRELAMRQTAQAVESRAGSRRRCGRAAMRRQAAGEPASSGPAERLLLLMTPDPSSAALIRRGRRVADYLHAECVAVYVAQTPDLAELPRAERAEPGATAQFRAAACGSRRACWWAATCRSRSSASRASTGVTQIFVSREDARRRCGRCSAAASCSAS